MNDPSKSRKFKSGKVTITDSSGNELILPSLPAEGLNNRSFDPMKAYVRQKQMWIDEVNRELDLEEQDEEES